MSFDLYPFVRGWEYGVVPLGYKKGFASVGGGTITLDIPGPVSLRFLAVAVGGSVDAKYSTVVGEILEGGRTIAKPLEFTFYQLYESGAWQVSDFAPTLAKYDETQGAYVMVLGSQMGYMVAREGQVIRVELTPPPSPVELPSPSSFEYEIAAVYRRYTPEAERSLREVLGVG